MEPVLVPASTVTALVLVLGLAAVALVLVVVGMMFFFLGYVRKTLKQDITDTLLRGAFSEIDGLRSSLSGGVEPCVAWDDDMREQVDVDAAKEAAVESERRRLKMVLARQRAIGRGGRTS